MVEKSGVKKSGVEKSGVGKFMVVKSGVEMSFNQIFKQFQFILPNSITFNLLIHLTM